MRPILGVVYYRHFTLALLSALLMLFFAQSGTAYAATITVNTTSDVSADDGECSLPEAITAANSDTASGAMTGECAAGSGDDTIAFSVTLPGTITLTSGELPISNNLTINGPGAGSLTIDGNASSRIFSVGSGVTVSITGLTLTNGNDLRGGGIFNFGDLTLTDITVSGNTAISVSLRGGGGIHNSGTLSLSNSTVSGNTSSSIGGGITTERIATLTLSNSTVSGNSATLLGGGGGGIFNFGGTLSLSNSTVSGNSTPRFASGGGINHRAGTLSLSNSTVSGNTASAGGGIVIRRGTVTLSNSTVSGNTASAGGGIANSSGTVTLSNSTVSGNTASSDGAGIFNSHGTLSLSNSTVSGNSASRDGAGIFNPFGTVTMSNSTVSGNSASRDGGGIANGSNTVNFKNTIIAGNTAGSGLDCSGTLTSQGHNLVGISTGCPSGGTGDLTTADAKLDLLADNGGPTFTHALLVGSPAIDAGDPAGCTDAAGNPLTTDQRGVTRPQGADCDIGAFEVGTVTCTAGFWKNHEEAWSNLDSNDEPTWGGGKTYIEILKTAPKKGDASVILAHAFIAATLNTGADVTDLADAEALLIAHPIGSGDLKAGKNADPDRAVAIDLAEDLQAFNESGECSLE